MKTFILSLMLIASFYGYSQKSVYIYNLSSTNFDIGDIGTQKDSTFYPKFSSNPTTATNIPAYTTYSLVASPASTTVFPFYSPSSNPDIDYWSRIITPGATPSDLPSNLVASIYGATQVIDYVKFQLGPNGSLGGATLSLNSGNSFSDFYLFGSNGVVSIDVIDPNTGLPSANGETWIIITD